MNDLKEMKQAVVIYGLYEAFLREMLRTWASSNKATLHVGFN